MDATEVVAVVALERVCTPRPDNFKMKGQKNDPD